MVLSITKYNLDVINKNRDKKTQYARLLSNINLSIGGPQLTAIMGQSGSGKSTLLKTLVGEVEEGALTSGEITYRGGARTIDNWYRKVGYVEQFNENRVDETMTLNHLVKRYSTLKRLSGWEERIKELKRVLHLNVVDTISIKNLSGGQRKRVFIALELLEDKNILFLDEPTTGLDNESAKDIIEYLRGLALEGMSIIITIHQPDTSLISLIDSFVFMESGQVIYSGAFSEAEEYFIKGGFKKRGTSTLHFIMDSLSVDPRDEDDLYKRELLMKMVKKSPDDELSTFEVQKSNLYYRNYNCSPSKILYLISSRIYERLSYKYIRFNIIALILIVCDLIMKKKIYSFVETGVNQPHVVPILQTSMEDFRRQIIEILISLKMAYFSFYFPLLLSILLVPTLNIIGGEYITVQYEIKKEMYSGVEYFVSLFTTEYLFGLFLVAVSFTIKYSTFPPLPSFIFKVSIVLDLLILLGLISTFLLLSTLFRSIPTFIGALAAFFSVFNLNPVFSVFLILLAGKIGVSTKLLYILDSIILYLPLVNLTLCGFIKKEYFSNLQAYLKEDILRRELGVNIDPSQRSDKEALLTQSRILYAFSDESLEISALTLESSLQGKYFFFKNMGVRGFRNTVIGLFIVYFVLSVLNTTRMFAPNLRLK